MKEPIKFPFLNDELLSYVSNWETKQPNFEWRDNEVFTDTIKYITYSRGQSSALLVFERESNGQRLQFFMTDANNIIPLLVNGKYTGSFTYTKRGQNYAVKAII